MPRARDHHRRRKQRPRGRSVIQFTRRKESLRPYSRRQSRAQSHRNHLRCSRAMSPCVPCAEHSSAQQWQRSRSTHRFPPSPAPLHSCFTCFSLFTQTRIGPASQSGGARRTIPARLTASFGRGTETETRARIPCPANARDAINGTTQSGPGPAAIAIGHAGFVCNSGKGDKREIPAIWPHRLECFRSQLRSLGSGWRVGDGR